MVDSETQPGPSVGSQVLRNTLLSAAQQVIAIVVGLLLMPFMLGRMGAERYGVLIVVQIFSLSGVLAYADLGLHSAATRHLAATYARQDEARFGTLLATTFAAFLAIGVVCGAVVVAFTGLLVENAFRIPAQFQREARLALYLYGATLPLQFATLGLKAFYAAVQDFVALKAWESLVRLAYAAGVVAVLLRAADVFSVVIVEQAASLALFGCFAIVARRRYREWYTMRFWRASWQEARRMGGLGLHVFVNYISTYGVYHKAPDVIVASLLGPAEVAYFTIVSRIPRMLKTLTAAVSTAVAPMAAALDGLALRAQLGDLVLRGARYSYVLLTPAVACIVVFADEILRFWVGAEYVFLANLLRAFVVWQHLMFFVLYTNATMTQEAHYARVLPFSLAANAVFLACAITGAHAFGLWAIVGGQLVSLAILVAGSARLQRGRHDVGYAELFRVVFKMPVVFGGLAVLAMCLVARVSVAPHGLWAVGSVVALVYVSHLMMVYRFGLVVVEREQLTRLVRRALRG